MAYISQASQDLDFFKNLVLSVRCIFHLNRIASVFLKWAIQGSNPKHTFLFIVKFCTIPVYHCVVKRTKIHIKDAGIGPYFLKTIQFSHQI